jgi:Ca2+-binding EF-hand superfamily protein
MSQNLKKAFDEYDTDRSGKIEGNELKQALEKAGKNPSIKECDWLISQVDKNGKNLVF